MKHLSLAPGFYLPLDAVTQTIGVLGKRGGGKTYVAKVLAEEMFEAGAHIACVDPIGNWWGLRLGVDGKAPGLPITVLGGDYGDVPLEANEKAGEFVARLIVEEKLSVIIDISRFRKNEQTAFMIGWAETLYRINRSALHLFVDEADAWAPQKPIGNLAPRLLGAMEDLVRRGRAKGLGMTMITQRSAVINKDLLTQIEVLVAKRTIAPQDREAIDAWVKVHGTPDERKTLMDSLASLPLTDAWFWSPAWLDIFERVTVRKLKTFDSSATPEVGHTNAVPKKLGEVDLARLTSRMAETIEKAKASDPVLLQREVTNLRRQLAERDKRQAGTPVDPDAERQRIQEAVDKAVAKALDAQKRFFEQKLKEFVPGISHVIADIVKNHFSMNGFHAPEVQVSKAAASSGVQWHESPSSINSKIERVPSTAASRTSASRLSSSGSAGWKRMLIALAQRNGLSARQLGLRAGLSSKSGTFGTYMSKLRQEGYIEGSSESIRITPEGLKALGSYDSLPAAGPDLLRYWQVQLGSGSGASRILQALASAGHPLSHEEVGERVGLSNKSGTYGTYLSKLRTLELITGSREITLAEELWSTAE